MAQLKNVEIFASSVLNVLDQLYQSFPILIELSHEQLTELYGSSNSLRGGRKLWPMDKDYLELLPKSFAEGTAIKYIIGKAYSEEHVRGRNGEPIWYWTDEERQQLEEAEELLMRATTIFDESIDFLEREGYVYSEPSFRAPGRSTKKYVLTSRGFAQLNKKFENGTIQSSFETSGLIKASGDVATAGTALVALVAKFLGGT